MATVLASTAVWNEEPQHLKDFARRHPLPCLAMVRRGHYRGVILPDQVVYVHHLDTGQKVLAEAVKHPRRRGVGGGGGGRGGGTNYYSLPTTYAGWFELLSEDGKPVQPIQSVEELVRASPHRCIVREALRVPFTAPGSDNFSTERQRLLGVGERLTLRGEVDVAFRGSRGSVATRRYLRCSAGDGDDDGGDSVYLGFDVRAPFSPIADDDGETANSSISGVHSLRGLVERFRLPVVVRLVCGNIPLRVERGFVPVFRLIGAYRDETVFLLPVVRKKEEDEEEEEREEAKLIAVSTREPLFVVGAKNTGALRENSEFQAMKTKCAASLCSYSNSIQVLADLPDGRAISRGGKVETLADRIKTGETSSNPDSDEYELLLFEEIEEIYRYVREGGDPPQPKTRPVSTKTAEVLTLHAQNSTLRPPPTISRLRRPSGEETERSGGEVVTTLVSPSGATCIQTAASGKEAAAAPGNNATLDGIVSEEQIYEDIDKIRERKQLEKSSRSKSPPTTKLPLETKRTTTTTTTTATESRAMTTTTPQITESSTTGDSKSKAAESLESDGMVKSLRQVCLRSQLQPSSFVKAALVRDKLQVPSFDDDDDDDDGARSTLSPPVPPKLFEEGADAANNSAKILAADRHRPVEAATEAPSPPPPSLAAAPRPKSQPPKVPAKSKHRILSSDQPPPAPSTSSSTSGPSVDGKPVATATAAVAVAVAEKVGSLQEIIIEEPDRTPGITRARPADAAAVHKAAEVEFASSAAAATTFSSDTAIPPQAKSSILSATAAASRFTPGLRSGNTTADITASPPPFTLNPEIHRPPLDHTIVLSTIPPPSVPVKPDSNPDDVPTKHDPSDVAVLRRALSSSPASGKHDLLLSTFSVKQNESNPFDQSTGPDSLQSIGHEHINTVSSTNRNPTSATPEHIQLPRKIGPVNDDQTPKDSLPSPAAGAATGQTESSHRPAVISTNSGSRVNWAPGVGLGPQGGPSSTVQVGSDSVGGGGLNTTTTTTNSNGVTTIRVSGVSSNHDPKFSSQGGDTGYTQIYVRFPNSPYSGQTLYRPSAGSLSGTRVQSGTVYLTNGKAGVSDHWV